MIPGVTLILALAFTNSWQVTATYDYRAVVEWHRTNEHAALDEAARGTYLCSEGRGEHGLASDRGETRGRQGQGQGTTRLHAR